MHLAVLGCGSMATSILSGYLKRNPKGQGPLLSIQACVRSSRSAESVKGALRVYCDRLRVRVNEDVAAVAESGAVLLAHKPYQLQSVLRERGMAEAIRGRPTINILAGVSATQIRGVIGGESGREENKTWHPDIVRMMPNVGARIGESMTLLFQPKGVSDRVVQLATDLFESVGRVTEVPEATYDLAAVLTGAYYSMTTVAMEGMILGTVQQGLHCCPVFQGPCQNVKAGEHPTLVRKSILSPADVTGIVELEHHSAHSVFAKTIMKPTQHTNTMSDRQD